MCDHYGLGCLILAVNVIDRFLSRQLLAPADLQLFGAAAMLVASKLKDDESPTLSNMCACAENAFALETLQVCLCVGPNISRSLSLSPSLSSSLSVCVRTCGPAMLVASKLKDDESPTLGNMCACAENAFAPETLQVCVCVSLCAYVYVRACVCVCVCTCAVREPLQLLWSHCVAFFLLSPPFLSCVTV